MRAGAVIDRVLRPDFAYVVWILAACALACAGDLGAALRTAERGVAATRGVPVVALPCLAAQAHLLTRMARHDEAARAMAELQATAERLDSAPLLALARHDAGLVALAAGRPREAADLLAAALDGQGRDPPPGRPVGPRRGARRRRCADEAAAELRRATLEPVRLADQAWALVPQVARVQGLVARARGDLAEARRRLTESADGWRRRRAPRARWATSTWQRWSTSAAHPSSGWWNRSASWPGSPPSWRNWRTHARVHADRPRDGARRGRLEAALRPGPLAEWWQGIETVEVASPGDYTVWHEGYPEFPMTQRLRADHRAGQVVMSCQVSDIDFTWQLAEDGDGDATTITVAGSSSRPARPPGSTGSGS